MPVFPYKRDQFWPWYQTMDSLADECLDDDRTIARHMSTADVARDMDLLRRALGDKKITYLGFSYGSFLGNTYANLFPKNVRALVIDGVLDPRLWSSGQQIRSDRVATQEEFEEFLRLCDAAGPECAFGGAGGAAARWDTLATAVRKEPVVLPDGFVYSYDFLIADAASAMYGPDVWGGPDGYAAFFDFVAGAVSGDSAAAKQASATRKRLQDRLHPSGAHEADYDNGFDAYFGNHCADAQYPDSFAKWRAIGRYASAGSQFGPYWWWFNNGCSDWPVAADRYIGPWTANTSAPVLVVGNRFDGVTDLAGARASARLLKNSRLLTYAGWGHTAYGISECTTSYINDYLIHLRLPPRGTVCPANPNPFLAAPEARSQGSSRPLFGRPPVLPQLR